MVAMETLETSLLDDLDVALRNASSDKRADLLNRVTNLFLSDAARLNDQQIDVFDDVLCHLIENVEARALAVVSVKLAAVLNAPPHLALSLANHPEISVARPVLVSSPRLTTERQVGIANTTEQNHLLALSERRQLETVVTDVLVDRGNKSVLRSVATNSGARFSAKGFAALVKASESDEGLAEKTGRRLDLPQALLRELLLHATEAVRTRLLSRSSPAFQEEIERLVRGAAETIERESSAFRDYRGAMAFVISLREKGQLNEAKLLELAQGRHFAETAAALALLASTSLEIVKPLMQSSRNEGLLIPCKAADLKWATVSAILEMKLPAGAPREAQHSALEAEYAKSTKANALRTLAVWKTRVPAARSG
jgi:uncharacterized protein (DUF2336 family)